MMLEPGTRLGHYEVLASLGAGGMGEVYQARDTKLEREVAIKVLPDGFSADPERLLRFEREAKVLASVNHSNVATLYGFERHESEADGTIPFLVMELVPGETLAERLKRGPIPIDEALPIFRQIAAGLEAAHDRGIVHRDLKPANIKITDDGPKVLDFGLAKAMAPETVASGDPSLSMSPTLTLAATQRGEILGTAAYMSPEQAKGKAIDKRTDVWAFGVCLLEALSGQRAFEGEDASELLGAVMLLEPNWESVPASTPAILKRLLRRCLEKDPSRRIHDIADVRLEIEEAMRNPASDEPVASVVPVLRLNIAAVIAALLAGVAIASFTAWSLRPEPPRADLARFTLSATPTPPPNVSNRLADIDITADGRHVVYEAGNAIYARPLDSREGLVLTSEGSAGGPFVSPDGQWVGFWSRGQGIRKVSIRGGPSLPITALGSPLLGATWGLDDTVIFGALDQSGLFRVPAGGGEPEAITVADARDLHAWPSILPGGRSVLFTILQLQRPDDAQIAILDLASGEHRVLIPGGSDPRYVPSGHIVYGIAGTLRAVAFDLDTLELAGDPFPVIEGVTTKNSGAANFAVSDTGTLVYVAGGRGGPARSVLWVDPDGRTETVGIEPRSWIYPRISPDGESMVLASQEDDLDLWVYHFSRKALTRFTFDPAMEIYGVWAPDGSSIVFDSSRSGTSRLYRRAADGTGGVESLTGDADGDSDVAGAATSGVLGGVGNQFPSSFTPDGKKLLYRLETGNVGASDVGVLSFDGKIEERPLLSAPHGELNAEVSPDGLWLTYESNESGQAEIFVRPFPDVEEGRWQISNNGGVAPRWSHDGRRIFYVQPAQGDQRGDRFMAVDVDTRTGFLSESPQVVFEATYLFPTGRNYDVSPKDGRFLTIQTDGAGESDRAAAEVVLVQNWFEELERLAPIK